MSERNHYLVLFDADRIQDYVFATGRLREIRGASELVRRLTAPRPLRRKHGDSDGTTPGLLVAGGGAGALLLDFATPAAADAFCLELERHYQEETGGATLTAVAVPVHPEPEHPCAAEREAASAEERALARACCAEAEAHSAATLALASRQQLQAQPGPFTSDSAEITRARGDEFEQSLPKQPWWKDAFLRKADHRERWKEAINAGQEIAHIGAQATPAGYVALVHVDGDGIGRALGDVVASYGFAGYQALSAALSKAASQATGRGLAGIYKRFPLEAVTDREGVPRPALPFEVITIGGDDIVLLCTAERGLAVAERICRRFGALLAVELQAMNLTLGKGQRITASAGVVIAPDSVPIAALASGASDLLAQAKAAGNGRIDFQIVTSPELNGIARTRESEDQVNQRDPDRELTRRPYTIDQTRDLLVGAGALRRTIPDSELTDLERACRGDRADATRDVLAIYSRLEPGQQQTLSAALRALDSVEPFPFGPMQRGDSPAMATALRDLIEASRFIAIPAASA